MRKTRVTMTHTGGWTATTLILLVVLFMLPDSGAASASGYADSSLELDAAGDAVVPPRDKRRTLAGRHRLEVRAGYWDSGRRQNPLVEVHVDEMTRVEDLLGAFSYAYWVHDQIATAVTMRGLVVEAVSIDRDSESTESATVITSAMFGIRIYPISSTLTPLRPYIDAGAGPYLGIESRKEIDSYKVENTKTLGSFGGYVGGGLDIQMGRHLMTGIHVGYNAMADFPEPLELGEDFSGFELSVGISVLLGKGAER